MAGHISNRRPVTTSPEPFQGSCDECGFEGVAYSKICPDCGRYTVKPLTEEPDPNQTELPV